MRSPGSLFAVVVLAALAGCGGASSPQAGGNAVQVTVKAGAGENGGIGSSCGNANFGTEFAGLPGAQVTVTNESGTTVGVGQVPTSGTIRTRATPGGPFGVYTEDCVFTFEVKLDGDAKFYKFDLGERFGSNTIAKSDLEAQGYKPVFDLVQ